MEFHLPHLSVKKQRRRQAEDPTASCMPRRIRAGARRASSGARRREGANWMHLDVDDTPSTSQRCAAPPLRLWAARCNGTPCDSEPGRLDLLYQSARLEFLMRGLPCTPAALDIDCFDFDSDFDSIGCLEVAAPEDEQPMGRRWCCSAVPPRGCQWYPRCRRVAAPCCHAMMR